MNGLDSLLKIKFVFKRICLVPSTTDVPVCLNAFEMLSTTADNAIVFTSLCGYSNRPSTATDVRVRLNAFETFPPTAGDNSSVLHFKRL